MTDEAEPSTTDFTLDIQQAYKPLAVRLQVMIQQFMKLQERINAAGVSCEMMAKEHADIVKNLSRENFTSFSIGGPALASRIYVKDTELVEKLMRDRVEEIQKHVYDHLIIFDQWDEALDVFKVDFKHHVEDLFGEGSAKEIA